MSSIVHAPRHGDRAACGAALAFAATLALAIPAHAEESCDGFGVLAPALQARLGTVAGPHRAWVLFTDRGFDTADQHRAALRQAALELHPRAEARRRLRGRAAHGGPLVDEHDLPVRGAYVEAVAATGAELRRTSRWLNAVSVEADAEVLRAIAELPFVAHMQPVARRDSTPTPAEPAAAPADGTDYGMATLQLEQAGIIALHETGATGEGVVIGILDTGFQLIHDAFNQPDHPVDVIASWDFVSGDGEVGPEEGDPWSQHYHGTYILGTIGAWLPGTLVGGAPDASFILCKTEDVADEYQGEEDNYVAALEYMEGLGADLSTSSLAYYDWYSQDDMDGVTAITSIGLNLAAAQGMHACTAASNRGHDSDPSTNHLGAPADALHVLTSGAVDDAGAIAGFSSDGPSADGRVKPEVLSHGVGTRTVLPDTTDEYAGVSGTSLSTPILASAVACVVQAHPDWTVEEMRAAFTGTALDMVANGTFDPLYVRGYGIIDAYEAARDCNDNAIPDLVEILDGTAPDEDGDGIPDECQVDPCPEDVDDDGVVAVSDLLAVLGDWGATEGPADVNGDGVVDVADLLAVLAAWGACG